MRNRTSLTRENIKLNKEWATHVKGIMKRLTSKKRRAKAKQELYYSY